MAEQDAVFGIDEEEKEKDLNVKRMFWAVCPWKLSSARRLRAAPDICA